jgi:CheY-specific phosphatase CheX
MSVEMDTAVAEQVLTIADELFTAMITGEPGSVRVHGGPVELGDPVHAWVDVSGGFAARAMLSTEATTASDLARLLLGMTPDETVSWEDLVDAFGEMANVVGGNVKSMLPEQGVLSLPQVSHDFPGGTGDLHRVDLDWAGKALVISIWNFDGKEDDR